MDQAGMLPLEISTHVEQCSPLHKIGSLQSHDRQLQHLCQKPITPQLLRDTTHYKFVAERADEKCDQRSHVARHVRSRSKIDMAAQKMMDRDVPFARKLQP